jgi:hypothetical protein
MAVEVGSPFPKLEDVPPPPRSVPFRLCCHLLAGPVTVGGSAGFAFGMVFALIFAPATDPVGTWRLRQRRQEAPGWLEAVVATSFHEGGDEGEEGTPIYRHDYSFRLPDGTALRGSSYTVGQQFQLPAPAPGGPPPRLQVTVEYDPDHPVTNRIRGTRTSPYTPWVLLVLLFPAAGLLVALGGLLAGRRRLRLLRDGECTAATVTACRFGAGEDAADVPVAEYKQRLANLRGGFGGSALVAFAGAFLWVWTLLATVFLVFGTVVCVAALVLVFVVPMPPREKSLFGLAVTAFLVLWLTMGLFMVRHGWQAVWAAGRRHQEPAPYPPVNCAFEFRPPDGAVVQARGAGRLAEVRGAEPPQPVLYDPARPTRALLLSGLWPAVRVGPYGGWETTAGADAFLRLFVVLLLVAGPLAVWALLR